MSLTLRLVEVTADWSVFLRAELCLVQRTRRSKPLMNALGSSPQESYTGVGVLACRAEFGAADAEK